ncbi:MAG: hypothetical protein JWN56_2858 [Sphingobacteriales bacterium]|nr:hypothetical protein [Sphingobacteriales bacterium]
MQQNPFQILFQDSFDTFKVFHAITPEEIGCILPQAPKTIWQILNHIIAWQDYQISLLQSVEYIDLNEDATWTNVLETNSKEELQQAVSRFHGQIQQVKDEASKFDANDPFISTKLKIVQDLSVHLSFHLGEIILIRRMLGTYPLPHEMSEFLS